MLIIYDNPTINTVIKLNLKYNNTVLYKHININNATIHNQNIHINKIKNITIGNVFTKLFKISNHNTFYICNNKLITNTHTLYNLILDTHNDINKCIDTLPTTNATYNIECFSALRGGNEILDMVLKGIEMVFDPIIAPIVAIGDVFLFLIQLITWFVKFMVWFIFFIVWLFYTLLNPVNLIRDFGNSMLLIIITIISTIFDTVLGLIAYVANTIGGWTTGFWGWDQSSLTKNDKNSNYFKSIDRKKGKKCYLTNTNTIPFSILLGTILCPPMGVFMNLGLTGWFNIVICILLTLCYYLPGLFYALLVIYS